MFDFSPKKYTVNLFVPCHMDLFLPYGVQPILSLLEGMGEIPYYNSELTCCGRQFLMRGEIDAAQELAFRLVRYFDNGYPIVCPSSDCVGYLKKYAKQLCQHSAVQSAVAHVVQDSYELCDYIVNKKHVECLNNTFNHKVFYFRSCSARNIYPSDDAITLLQNTKGLELVTDPDMKLCCCGNGDFALHNGELTELMLKQIVDRISSYDVEFVTSTDLHCLQYIDAYIATRNDVKFNVVPIAEILKSEK